MKIEKFSKEMIGIATILWLIAIPLFFFGQTVLISLGFFPTYDYVGWNVQHNSWNTDIAVFSYYFAILPVVTSAVAVTLVGMIPPKINPFDEKRNGIAERVKTR